MSCAAGELARETAVVDGHTSARSQGLTGPSPVDRSSDGSTHHLLTVSCEREVPQLTVPHWPPTPRDCPRPPRSSPSSGLDRSRSGAGTDTGADSDLFSPVGARTTPGGCTWVGRARAELLTPAVLVDLSGFPPLLQVGHDELLDDSTSWPRGRRGS